MIQRMRAGERTSQDLAFYAHELYEKALMDGGLEARAAHLATLKAQRIPYKQGYEINLFHPSVILRYPEYFHPSILKVIK